MEEKIERLLHEVERLLTHVGHHIPPEAVQVDDLKKLIKEIRQERSGLSSDRRFSPREPRKPE